MCFVNSILNDKPIEIYNDGKMYRDFTYVDDLVHGIKLLMGKIPSVTNDRYKFKNDSISSVAPFRIVNIGNSNKVNLLDFVNIIEKALDKKAIRNYMPIQKGDLKTTWADASLLKNLTNYKPNTNIKDGVFHFVKWFREYYKV